jgi:hypothetical protein
MKPRSGWIDSAWNTFCGSDRPESSLVCPCH